MSIRKPRHGLVDHPAESHPTAPKSHQTTPKHAPKYIKVAIGAGCHSQYSIASSPGRIAGICHVISIGILFLFGSSVSNKWRRPNKIYCVNLILEWNSSGSSILATLEWSSDTASSQLIRTQRRSLGDVNISQLHRGNQFRKRMPSERMRPSGGAGRGKRGQSARLNTQLICK